MAEATRDLLRAAGLDPAHPDLARTGERVAEAWCSSFLDGYAADPHRILARTIPSQGASPVLVRDIAFHSLCPHHLLPFRGVAHVAYVPEDRAVGFSTLARLVDCFAHRLTLQERISREVALALCSELGAKAAACALDAEQTCVTLRGVERRESRVWTEAVVGDAAWRRRLEALLTLIKQNN